MGGEPTPDEWEGEAFGHLHMHGPSLASTAPTAHRCEEHRQDMDYCCLSCMAFICDACRGTEHRWHRVLRAEDATVHLHAELENAVGGPVSERIHEYASAARLVRARRSEIENQAMELEALIQTDFEAVVRAANKRRRELLKVLHTTAAAKQGELCRQEMELTAMAEGLRVTAEGALSAATHILHSATAHAGDISAKEPLPSNAPCGQTCSAVGAVQEIVRLKREVLFASSQGLDWWCGPVEDADLCLDLTSRDEDLALIKSRGWVGESRSYERQGDEAVRKELGAGVGVGECVRHGMVRCWSGKANQRSGASRNTKTSSLAMLYSAASKLIRFSSSRDKPRGLARGT